MVADWSLFIASRTSVTRLDPRVSGLKELELSAYKLHRCIVVGWQHCCAGVTDSGRESPTSAYYISHGKNVGHHVPFDWLGWLCSVNSL